MKLGDVRRHRPDQNTGVMIGGAGSPGDGSAMSM